MAQHPMSPRIPGGPPAGVSPMAGPPPAGGPPGVPAGAISAAMVGARPKPVHQRANIVRSLRLLDSFRGPVTLLILLGLVVAALPFVSNAAFGPMTQVMAEAFQRGSLADAWGLSGPLMGGPGSSPSGLFGWLGTPLPFAVLLTIWAAALVLAQLLGFAHSWIDAQVDRKLLTEIRQRTHDHIQSLSLDFFTGARSGSLMQRVQMEAGSVQRLLTECLIPPAVDVVILAVALAYLIALSWQMTLVTLILSPFVLIWLRFAGQRLQAATRRNMMGGRRMGGELEETISGITDIQVFNAQSQRSRRFLDASDTAAKDLSAMMIWLQATSRSVQVFIALSTALVLIVGVAFSTSFGLDLASLLVFVSSVPTMFASFQRIVTAWTTYKSIAPQVESTYDLLDTEPTVRELPDATALGEVHGNIEFEDVAFGYTPEQKILDGVSFSIREGETVALVGAIGCGKSTIFNLLLRFIDPQRGRILLDGHDISEVTIASLREQVSKLAQFPFFMKDAIRENIRLARQNATDEQIEEACRLAHVHPIIVDPAKMPEGYDTVVDVQVPSGGQKRLIAMARCLLRKPEVLLLDEPTENLDADQRTRLTTVIREYARDRTCVVISHDMDFIAAVADRVIVLGGGKVVQEGTHHELLAAGGLYKKLYEAQNVEPSLVRPAAAAAGPVSPGA
ncbi:ABC transporter ATP-binding protein [Mycobacterium sp. pV006]|uniref:ABC transporter ATP-binding protein n=1 Tax=Mycobacterium sp. pV006 TaxID=3238983 RepID=UPI00351B085F